MVCSCNQGKCENDYHTLSNVEQVRFIQFFHLSFKLGCYFRSGLEREETAACDKRRAAHWVSVMIRRLVSLMFIKDGRTLDEDQSCWANTINQSATVTDAGHYANWPINRHDQTRNDTTRHAMIR